LKGLRVLIIRDRAYVASHQYDAAVCPAELDYCGVAYRGKKVGSVVHSRHLDANLVALTHDSGLDIALARQGSLEPCNCCVDTALELRRSIGMRFSIENRHDAAFKVDAHLAFNRAHKTDIALVRERHSEIREDRQNPNQGQNPNHDEFNNRLVFVHIV
jgi:hypothetical protein